MNHQQTAETGTYDMIEAAINFWFNGQDEVRSPFPDYIKPELYKLSSKRFNEWVAKLNDEARKELNDEILAERFEEILFEAAYQLVQQEDERITIKYPFMPRVNDSVKQEGKPESVVIAREIKKEADHSFMLVYFSETESGKKWNTSFELFES